MAPCLPATETRVLLKMLKCRGYRSIMLRFCTIQNVTSNGSIGENVYALASRSEPHQNPEPELVVYIIGPKLSLQLLRDIRAYISTNSTIPNDVMLITCNGTTCSTTSECERTSAVPEFVDISIQIYPIEYLAFDILEHCLVPEHRLLDDDELKTRGIQRHNCLSIKQDDPVCKYFNWPIGSIVEITITTCVQETSHTLRIVVP